jgi:hypothetical protein
MKKMLVCLLFAGCAATPKSSSTPATARATSKSTARTTTRSAVKFEPSLLALVPEAAVAALVVDGSLLSGGLKLAAMSPEVEKELNTHFLRTLGLDPMKIDRLVAFSTQVDPKPLFAVALHFSGGGALKLPELKRHEGVPLHRVVDQLVAAVAGEWILIGQEHDVVLGLDRIANRVPALSAHAPLGALLAAQGGGLALALASTAVHDAAALKALQQFGVRFGLLQYHSGLIRFELHGESARLESLRVLFQLFEKTMLASLDAKRQEAQRKPDVLEGAINILTYHQVRQLTVQLEPRIEADRLVSEAEIPTLIFSSALPGLSVAAALLGSGAAMAVPGLQKYTQLSTATEARTQLQQLRDRAVAYHEAHRQEGNKFRFPASTAWTPALPCCTNGNNRCPPPTTAAFAHPTWVALGFAPTEALHYQYRFVSEGQGPTAHFSLEARGDLDCDGTFSSFVIRGKLDDKGLVSSSNLEAINERE